MHKIELKRVYRENAPDYNFNGKCYDQSKFIIEFKLLSELQESDKEKLNIFLTQDFINKGIINHIHLGGWQYMGFDFNLEEINKNINKITNITKYLSNDGFIHCFNCSCSCSRCNKHTIYDYEINKLKKRY